MGKIIAEIRSGKRLVSDGAWGTFLQRKGLKAGECPELWNITHPEQVLDIALSYIQAGADLIETNSFGGNAFKLAHYGLEGRVEEINQAAAEISRKAAGPDKYVLGSMGPTGKILMMGDATPEEFYEAFRQQAMALEAGGADAIMVETMTDLEEATLAIKAAKENTQCEVFCTMTFDKTVDDQYRTMMGISPADMAQSLVGAGADLIGTNCGNGIENMIGIVHEIRAADPNIPILVQANAGMPVYQDGETVFPESPDEMSDKVKALIDAGANIIGGCCGTTPEHIIQIAKEVRNA